MNKDELKKLREYQGLSAVEFCKIIGVNYSPYSLMESGKRNITPIQAFKIRLAIAESKPSEMSSGELLELIQDII